jgi:hypothetical protein
VVGEQVDTLLASGILPALDRLDLVTTSTLMTWFCIQPSCPDNGFL